MPTAYLQHIRRMPPACLQCPAGLLSAAACVRCPEQLIRKFVPKHVEMPPKFVPKNVIFACSYGWKTVFFYLAVAQFFRIYRTGFYKLPDASKFAA